MSTANPQPERPRSLEDLVTLARRRGRTGMVVAGADETHCLEAVVRGAELGIVRPILIGNKARILDAANEAGVDITRLEIVDTPDDTATANAAVRMVHDGEADLLMKGSLPTRVLMHAVLNHEFGLATSALLSHVAVFEAPGEARLVLLTDAGISILPRFARKQEIILNAVDTAHRLGIAEPKVAVLAAIETLNLPAMPATLDAEMLRRLGEAGHFGKCIVAGPLSLDVALSADRSGHKGVAGAVAGHADVLVVPNIEAGNILYKSITCIAGKEAAGVVVGATRPIILSSRADTPLTKMYSIALGAVIWRGESN